MRARGRARRTPALRQHALPWLTQPDYDRLLWACDLNFVRGEDSWVRAHGPAALRLAGLRAGGRRARREVESFLRLVLARAPAAAAAQLRRWHAAWNGSSDRRGGRLPRWTPAGPSPRQSATTRGHWRAQLLAQPDLVTDL
jgi:hypothetical protein